MIAAIMDVPTVKILRVRRRGRRVPVPVSIGLNLMNFAHLRSWWTSFYPAAALVRA